MGSNTSSLIIPISIVGLSSSGKTTYTRRLLTGEFVSNIKLTPGLNLEFLSLKDGTRLEMFDMGGQSTFRSLWKTRVSTSHGIIYVIDGANPSVFEETDIWFNKVVKWAPENTIFMILINKKDLTDFVTLVKIVNKINFSTLLAKIPHSFRIFEISCLSGENIEKSHSWFMNQLTEKITKETISVKALFFYTSTGTPLSFINYDERFLETKNNENKLKDDSEILFTGFLSALDSFLDEILKESLSVVETSHYKLLSIKNNDLVTTIFVDKDDSISQTRLIVESVLNYGEKLVKEVGFNPSKPSLISSKQRGLISDKLESYLNKNFQMNLGENI